MGSRRPLSRSYSGNGRSGSLNGEETLIQGSRGDGRGYQPSVRAESRSTLCSVMAQLTEETQPSFETTLKSKAVSETCNVKFTCAVTGHPPPELTWYKDDMEMDRYCGLPKYEIFRNGKTHSLHIYNCTEEDAAIYQASARNAKGIVSCSGVLEVGTMNEYQIHQRFFAKLKQKAESKRKELEDGRQRGKEDARGGGERQHAAEPEASQATRQSLVREDKLKAPSLGRQFENRLDHEPQEATGPEAPAEIANGFPAETNEADCTPVQADAVKDKSKQAPTHTYESIENSSTKQLRKELPAKKKTNVCNGMDSGKGLRVSESKASSTEEGSEGRMSLAQYMAESLRSQALESEAEDRGTDACASKWPEAEAKHTGTSTEVEPWAPEARQTPGSNSQSPLTSMFFSLRDIFFGSMNKKEGEQGGSAGKADDLDEIRGEKTEGVVPSQQGVDDKAEEAVTMEINEELLSEDVRGGNRRPQESAQEPHEDSLEQDSVTPGSHGREITGIRGWESPAPEPGEQAGAEQVVQGTCRSPERTAKALPTALCAEDQDEPTKQDTSFVSRALDEHGSPEEWTKADAQNAETLQSQATGDVARRECSQSESSNVESTSVMEKASERMTSPKVSQGSLENTSEVQESVGDEESSGKSTTPSFTEVERADEQEVGNTDSQQTEIKPAQDLLSEENYSTTPETHKLMSLESPHLQLQDDVRLDTGMTEPEVELHESAETSLEPSIIEFFIPDVEDQEHLKTPHVLLQVNDGGELPCENTSVTKQSYLELPQVQPGEALEPLNSESHPAVILKSRREGATSPTPREVEDMTHKIKELKRDSSSATETPSEGIRETFSTSDHGELGETEVAPEIEVFSVATPMQEEVPKLVTAVDTPLLITRTGDDRYSKAEAKDSTSLVSLLREVKSSLDTEGRSMSPSLGNKEKTSSLLKPTYKNPDAREPKELHSRAVLTEMLSPERASSPDMLLSPPESPLRKIPLLSVTEADSDDRPKGGRADSPYTGPLKKDEPANKTSRPTSPLLPPLSPTMKRRFAAKGVSCLDTQGPTAIPVIQTEGAIPAGGRGEEQSCRNTTVATTAGESSPHLRRAGSLSLIPSATPVELALGARRKILIPKGKEEADNTTTDSQAKRDGMPRRCRSSLEQETPYSSPGQTRRSSFSQTPPPERRSPLVNRRKAALDVPPQLEKSGETNDSETGTKSMEKEKANPFKAPQVIRKIRGEPFSDTAGHLKLWCQFFNVLSDSTIKWYRDETEIAEVTRRSGDETQVALAIVQASSRDCGVYSCSIKNEFGADSTDFLLSVDMLSEFFLREDLGIGEEVEMTPMTFNKGLADSGSWGDKFFGRIVIQEAHLGGSCTHKACRAKVIYGLEPVFDSGSTCIIKVRNPIAYGTKEDSNLTERNLDITKEDCKVQNMAREYCKIFAAEARLIEGFGPALEVIPLYLIYRPANSVPYGTVEADLKGVFLRYSLMDSAGRLIMRNVSLLEQKCCAFQHWIHQWTNGNLLATHLEGVDHKITNIGIATKTKGYQGFSDIAKPQLFQQFVAQHQCNQYCGLLGLRSLKTTDSLQPPAKPKGSRSPLQGRKLGPGSSSPQAARKATSSPKVARKTESGESTAKHKTVEPPKIVRMR
ncbi:alpha-protein kinase 3-like isoform X2 [Brienomyrus brachyistius]|uniref:alpha-protein kinase 3-like isoform X2 n=1 Tax=Brienomyrus brachyistius TaxID=42636 RepID=UPI0020B43AC5|nr:alpha-protein kinase 3-like isoform X2 [Brienomyrus brachyistius]